MPAATTAKPITRRILIWVAIAISIGVALLLIPRLIQPVATETPQPSLSDSSASPSGEPSATLPAPSPPPAEPEELTARVEEALDTVGKILAMDPSAPSLDTVSTGAFKTMIELQRQEWEDLGWRQEGQPTVDQVKLVGKPDKDGSITVSACVDSTNVRVLDENGKDMRGRGTPARSRNIFTLRPIDGQWVVSDQTFAKNPDC